MLQGCGDQVRAGQGLGFGGFKVKGEGEGEGGEGGRGERVKEVKWKWARMLQTELEGGRAIHNSSGQFKDI